MLILVLFLMVCCTYALADTEIALEPCAGKILINEDNYILLTPDNLSDHPDLVNSIGMSQEDLLEDWSARGVQFQAWTKKMDSCLEVTVIQDEESAKYFDLEQKTRKERNEYLNLHKGSGRFAEEGFTILKPEWKKLVDVTKECVEVGIKHVIPWTFLGDMGEAVHRHALDHGYSIVREIGGHGCGNEFHEDPFVSYVSKAGAEMLMVPGMVFTIEPMVNMGTDRICIDDKNGWTVYTQDGKPSAEWEAEVLVTETGCEVLCW